MKAYTNFIRNLIADRQENLSRSSEGVDSHAILRPNVLVFTTFYTRQLENDIDG